jgi:hypothetical protein
LNIEEQEIKFSDVLIFPSIADEVLNIQCADFRQMKEYRFFNAQGVWVNSAPIRSEREELSCMNLAPGVYFITFIAENGSHLTQKFVVEHR